MVAHTCKLDTIWVVYILPIDLFHNNFSPSGKQPEHRKLVHEL